MMDVYDFSGEYGSVVEGFKAEAARTLRASQGRVVHCVRQLSDEDIWWRPDDGANAIGNMILHSCGNIRQWIVCGCVGEDSGRDRQGEFDRRDGIGAEKLLQKLDETIEAACAVIEGLNEAELTGRRVIQGFDTSVIAAVMHSMTHFEGHAQEVIYVTRMRLGDGYEFMWRP